MPNVIPFIELLGILRSFCFTRLGSPSSMTFPNIFRGGMEQPELGTGTTALSYRIDYPNCTWGWRLNLINDQQVGDNVTYSSYKGIGYINELQHVVAHSLVGYVGYGSSSSVAYLMCIFEWIAFFLTGQRSEWMAILSMRLIVLTMVSPKRIPRPKPVKWMCFNCLETKGI